MILRKLINLWRTDDGRSIRKQAEEIGIDHAAFHRFLTGEELSSANLCKVIVWALSPVEKGNNGNEKQPRQV